MSSDILVSNPYTPPYQDNMAHSPYTHPSPPIISANKSSLHTSLSPPLSVASAARSSSKDLDRDPTQQRERFSHQRSDSNNEQRRLSPPFAQYSPTPVQPSYSEHHQGVEEPHPYFGPSGQEQGTWRQQQYPQARESHLGSRERYPPTSPYHDAPYYSTSSSWKRSSSPSASQAGHKHLSFNRSESNLHRYPQPYVPLPPPSDIPQQRAFSGSGYPSMPLSPTRRGHIDSDSDESKNRIRPLEDDDPKPHLSYYEREHYPPAQYPYIDSNNGKPRHHAYTDIGREHHSSSAYPSSIPSDRLPQLAPQPPQHPIEEDAEPSGSQHQHQQQRQYSSQHSHVKKELAGAEPFKIQSARGTPKGPLPIDVQISLLRSVLKYDPYNCAIRKTTQAWEMISREQGIRARTCSRRFDNIIQANIGGRDRPVGTEEQQATKKKLLDQLFDMMNQPQALKRMQKKRRYRSEDTDRKLLVETIRLNPFAQKVGQVAKAWEDVRDALNMKVHARQCIRRVNRMVKPYQLRERMYKGNIPNEMREANDDLVKQVIQLMRSAGQSGSLDDACNSNDEDSAFYNSDSEEQDNYMDSKRQRNNQEDDELEEDDDEEMVSRSESEQQATGKSQEEGARPIRVTSRSPTVLASSPTSTHPTTPSLTISATSATDVPSSSSGPTTPTKRSRNSLPSTQSSQPSGLGPSDKSRPPTDGGSEEIAPAHTSHPNGPGQTHHYPQGEYEQSEYRGPVKHAQTSSRGGRDLPMDMSHHDRSRTISPGIGQPHGHHIREETYHRYETHPSKGQAVDSHGRPVDYTPSNREAVDSYARRGHHVTIAISDEAQQSSSQYQDIASELRHMRECLAQMEEHRRVDMDKQRSMMYMIEKLQSQMQQQQRHMHELQSQLRYSSSYPPQQTAPPPPPHSPHNSPHHHEQSQQPSLPFQGGLPGSVAPYQKSMSGTGRPLDRHSQGIQLHSSYSRSEAHYASHDREMR